MPTDQGALSAAELAADCGICLGDTCDAKLPNCGHVFHWNCLFGMVQANTPSWDRCPNCRGPIQNWFDREDDRWIDNSA